MKNLYRNKALLICLLLITASSWVNGQEASKSISESFNIGGDTRIEISNKYGNVIINRWDKNVFELKVDVEAKGKTEAKTQRILEAIDIDISDRVSSGFLSVDTKIGNINGNSSFSINYEINMPNTNPLKLRNSFGNVYMGSYKGDLDVEVKYGQMIAEDLDNAMVRVEFSNSKCRIESLKSGELDLRYAKMWIEDMGDLEISSQFSELEIENAGALELDGRYGSFEIENLRSLHGDIQFAGLDIEWLEEFIRLDTRHGDGIYLDKVSNKFKDIEIDGQFSAVNINMENGSTAQLDFELQFGNLKARGDGINFTRVIKDHTSSEYTGYLGSENATASIKVSTRYANIRLDVD